MRSASTTERPPDTLGALTPQQRAQYTSLYLVRHGETEWNTRDILQGQLDSALTERGLQQASGLVEQFRGVHFDAIFSSDLTRAERTAAIVALERQLVVTTSRLLRERNWGRYDGREARIYREECRDLIEAYNRLSHEERWKYKFCEDIESFEEVFARFMTFLRAAAVAYPGKTLLVVTHLDVLGALLLRLGESPKGIGNMAWVKLLTDGADMLVVETHGIDL